MCYFYEIDQRLMKITLLKLISLFLFCSFISCTFQNEEESFTVPICDSLSVDRDTINVYYQDLTYIFTDVCAQCHNTNFTYRPGINMDSYENVVASMNTGKALPAIKHEGNYKMPYNQPKLSDCEIQKIAIWIEKGMPKEKK